MAKKNNQKKRRLRWAIIGAAVVAALLLGWCGRGWFGGGSSGDEAASKKKDGEIRPVMSSTTDAGKVARCRVRIDENGITVDGATVSVAAAVEACRASGEAELVTTGLAKYGTVEALDEALGGAGVKVYRVGSKRGQPAD
jgi:hypothetical protein